MSADAADQPFPIVSHLTGRALGEAHGSTRLAELGLSGAALVTILTVWLPADAIFPPELAESLETVADLEYFLGLKLAQEVS